MPNTQLVSQARDELFSHINRCGVLDANPDDQEEWMDETIQYLGERFPDLSAADLTELRDIGMRFCRPAIPHGTATATGEAQEREEADASVG